MRTMPHIGAPKQEPELQSLRAQLPKNISFSPLQPIKVEGALQGSQLSRLRGKNVISFSKQAVVGSYDSHPHLLVSRLHVTAKSFYLLRKRKRIPLLNGEP